MICMHAFLLAKILTACVLRLYQYSKYFAAVRGLEAGEIGVAPNKPLLFISSLYWCKYTRYTCDTVLKFVISLSVPHRCLISQ